MPGKPAQSPAEASAASVGQLAPSVRPALGEALALYEDGKFVEAVQRAQGLAQGATGEARGELADWARDVTTFATLYQSLPNADTALLGALKEVQTAAQLDERLSNGKYARALRIRAARALVGRASSLGQNGHLVDACGELVRAHALAARSLTFREGGNPVLERRCESEAMRRVNQARMLERRRVSKPSAHKVQTPIPEAQVLFEQARSMSLPGSPAHLAAEQALGRSP
jgi:hypothetical protein